MSEIERLRRELERLKNQKFGMGSTFPEIGEWMLEIANLNLAIAELMLKNE